MTKAVQEVPVKIDELSLSLTGWEVEDFRARVVSERYASDHYHHQLAVSGVLRFNEFDWSDRFTGFREHSHYPTMLVFLWPLSNEPAISRIAVENIKNGRLGRIAESGTLIVTDGPIDCNDLEVRLTAYDYADTEWGLQEIPINIRQIPIELSGESDPSSVHLVVDLLGAFTYGSGESRWGRMRAAGRVSFGTADELFADEVSGWTYPAKKKTPVLQDEVPFQRPSPNLVFDIVDDTGFLLDQIMGYVGIQIPVDEHGQAPSRIPRWLVDHDFCPDRYSASPSRVIARIQDN